MAVIDLDEMQRLADGNFPVPWLKVLQEAKSLRQQLAAAEEQVKTLEYELDAEKIASTHFKNAHSQAEARAEAAEAALRLRGPQGDGQQSTSRGC